MPRVPRDFTLQLRPAVRSDQWTIRRIVWLALINPLDLDWRRFVVAEIEGRCVGVGQVKSHSGGLRELASIAVIPEWQGCGISSAIIRELLARESGPVYLTCRVELESYYERFGFHRLSIAEMPAYFRRFYGLSRAFTWIPGIGWRLKIIVMQGQGGTAAMESVRGKQLEPKRLAQKRQ